MTKEKYETERQTYPLSDAGAEQKKYTETQAAGFHCGRPDRVDLWVGLSPYVSRPRIAPPRSTIIPAWVR